MNPSNCIRTFMLHPSSCSVSTGHSGLAWVLDTLLCTKSVPLDGHLYGPSRLPPPPFASSFYLLRLRTCHTCLFFFQSQSVPDFLSALPPENLALPFSPKPGLVTIFSRHYLPFFSPVFQTAAYLAQKRTLGLSLAYCAVLRAASFRGLICY